MAERLDRALAARGFTRSRTEAAQLIAAGEVLVDGQTATKASHRVVETTLLEIRQGPRWVSRAAHKLIAALETFPIEIAGCTALDLGASTGGFTQVLLHRGAEHVIALDVGHDQLDVLLRADTRVTVVEGENARYLTAERLTQLAPGREPTLVVGDLSFISLRHILPAARASAPCARDFVFLLKPQFEVGRKFVRSGIVTSREVAADAAEAVIAAAAEVGLGLAGAARSPITGTHGNSEYLIWLRAHQTDEQDALPKLRRMVAEGDL